MNIDSKMVSHWTQQFIIAATAVGLLFGVAGWLNRKVVAEPILTAVAEERRAREAGEERLAIQLELYRSATSAGRIDSLERYVITDRARVNALMDMFGVVYKKSGLETDPRR
jgi:hypothetical protein